MRCLGNQVLLAILDAQKKQISSEGMRDLLMHFKPGVKRAMIISLFLRRDSRCSYRKW